MTHSHRRPSPEGTPEYYQTYTKKVPKDDFVQALKDGAGEMLTFLQHLSEEKWNHRYAPEKWSIKEVILHIIDTERIFAYRALRFARKDKLDLLGFDQNNFIPPSKADTRSIMSLIEEYEAVRNATIILFKNYIFNHTNNIIRVKK